MYNRIDIISAIRRFYYKGFQFSYLSPAESPNVTVFIPNSFSSFSFIFYQYVTDCDHEILLFNSIPAKRMECNSHHEKATVIVTGAVGALGETLVMLKLLSLVPKGKNRHWRRLQALLHLCRFFALQSFHYRLFI